MTLSSGVTLSVGLADFIHGLTLDTLPAAVQEKARTCLLNGYGIALGCHGTPFAPVARAAALALDGEQANGATLLGDGRKTTVATAAFANSALFHGRAQEDTCGAAHIGAIVIPLLTALLEARRLPLGDLLPALVAGYEAAGLLEQAYSGKTTPAGLRASPLYGTIGAAAAAARLLRLPPAGIAAALANAASFAGGTLQSFADGTDEWRYQVGVAGKTGLLAAELARAGSVSAPGAFEGKAGFVAAYARSDCDVAGLLAGLGKTWAVQRVTFKPYPVCAFNQTPVLAALELRQQIAGRAIQAVRVRMNPYEVGYAGMDAAGPFASVSGTLMSIPFCIAATLLEGVPTMTTMTTYDNAAINALAGRIGLAGDAAVPKLCCRIEADLADGSHCVIDKRLTFNDFSYSRQEVSALVRRVGRESGIAPALYDRLEHFVDGLPGGSIDSVIGCFAELPRLSRAA